MTPALLLPDGRPAPKPRLTVGESGVRVGDMLTRDEWAAIERMRQSRFFLVRNDGGEIRERARCGRCGLLHRYLTFMCVERPFRGLEDGLRACIRVAHNPARRSHFLRALSTLPDFASAHRETARRLTPTDPDSEAWYSVLVGGPEPITDDAAQRLAQRINDRRPPVPFIL